MLKNLDIENTKIRKWSGLFYVDHLIWFVFTNSWTRNFVCILSVRSCTPPLYTSLLFYLNLLIPHHLPLILHHLHRYPISCNNICCSLAPCSQYSFLSDWFPYTLTCQVILSWLHLFMPCTRQSFSRSFLHIYNKQISHVIWNAFFRSLSVVFMKFSQPVIMSAFDRIF